MFSNNSQNYGSVYNGDNISKAPITLTEENRVLKNKIFHNVVQSNNVVFPGCNHTKFCVEKLLHHFLLPGKL